MSISTHRFRRLIFILLCLSFGLLWSNVKADVFSSPASLEQSFSLDKQTMDGVDNTENALSRERGLSQELPPGLSSKETLDKIDPLLLEELTLNGQVDFFVWMREKADLSPAYQLQTKLEKGQFVFDTLRKTSARTQRDLRLELDKQGLSYRPFYISNKILVRDGQPSHLLNIAARADVSHLTANRAYQLDEPIKHPQPNPILSIEANLSFVQADQVWSLGYQGNGVILAGNDTGIAWNHPALIEQYRGWDGNNADHNYHWWDATGTYPTGPNDGDGHGTHTTGTMVGHDGGDNQIGLAPGSQTIHCKNLNDFGSGSEATIIECFEWDLAPWDLSGANPRPDLAPDAINNSWGFSGGNHPVFKDEIAALRAAGIVVEVSAGNSGPGCSTLGSPGDYAQSLTTGSVDHSSGVLPGTIIGFSSRGPSGLYPNEYIPDIMAPGENVRSSIPGDTYASFSGASMSGPHVTALIGLIWSANPSLRGLVEETEQIILDTAIPLTGQTGSNCGGDYVDGPNQDWGYGTMDALAAVQAALQYGSTGTLMGTISDDGTASTIASPTIKASLYPTLTWQTRGNSSGDYALTVSSGTYTIEASKYGYLPHEVTNVLVVSGTTTRLDIALEPADMYVVDGTVTDQDTGWPLYAQIEIDGYPGHPIWTDPVSGYYSLTLAAGITYTLNVAAWVSGYKPEQTMLSPLTKAQTTDIALRADIVSCTAPSYTSVSAYVEDFENGLTDWIATGLWNREDETDTCGALVAPFPSSSSAAYYGLDGLCTFAGAVISGTLTMSAPLTLPSSGAVLSFSSYEETECSGDCFWDNRYVEISTDKGRTWHLLGEGYLEGQWYNPSFDLSAFLGQDILIRFHFDAEDTVTNHYFGWMIDDVRIDTTCVPTEGGLVVGNVYDDNTSLGLNGTDIRHGEGGHTTSQATPDDRQVIDGFYTLFAPSGSRAFSATLKNYSVDLQIPTVVQSDTIRQDFSLTAGKLSYDPSTLSISVTINQTASVSLTLDNEGTEEATYALREFNRGLQLNHLPPGPFAQVQSFVASEAQNQPSAQGLNLPPAQTATPLAAGDVLQSWSSGLASPWGIAFDGLNDTLWVGLGWDLTNTIYEYQPDSTLTGRHYVYDWSPLFGPADSTFNWYTGMVWTLDVGHDNCLHEMDPNTGYTGDTICGPWSTSQRGVAYNPSSDTWYVGGWNDSTIYHIDSSGTLLDSAVVGLAISGLAYNAAAEHLFVQVSALNSTIYVLDAAQPGLYPTVGQFSVAEIGSSGGAGLTIDCEGDLWALDQSTNIIYEIDSGETATHCSQDVLWLSETPSSGTIAANQVIDITFDASVSNISQPGQYFAELKIDHDTPYALASVPVTMTVLASADMGRIEGLISSDRLGSSLSNARFEIISNSVTIISGTSESDGSYQWWLTGGTYDVRISASDYFSDTQTVLVSAGVTTTHDVTLTLNAPFISITPASLGESLELGELMTQTMTIENNGPAALTFELTEFVGQITPLGLTFGQPQINALDSASGLVPGQKVEAAVWTALDQVERGRGQGEFFVYFRDQADLRPAYAIKDWTKRGEFVLRTLRQTAQASQAAALNQLQSFVQSGQASEIRSHYIINVLYVKGSRTVVDALAHRDDVLAIRSVRTYAVPEPISGQSLSTIKALAWNISQIRANEVWDDFGIQGQGIVVANIDSGVRYNHAALVEQYRGNLGGGHFDHNYSWWDPDRVYDIPTDGNGHGSHTMGTMVGDDGSNQIGVAPAAKWIAAQGCDGYWCSAADLISSAEWILAPWDLTGDTDTADPSKRPHVVNNSWGGVDGDSWYMTYVDAWRAAGIFPVFAIGNSGPSCNNAASPGDYPQSFGVGATDSRDLIAYFSNRGPSAYGEIKPNISAPGVNVRSAWNTGDDQFNTMSGTSMASPHVAGLVALMWSASAGLVGEIDETATIIQETALGIPDWQCGDEGPPNNVYGWGRIDAYEAVSGSDTDVAWLSEEPISGTISAYSTLDISVVFDASQVDQLGTYRTTLRANSNDPYYAQADLAVTMTTSTPDTWGKLAGTVTGLAACDASGSSLEGADIFIQSGSGYTYPLTTGLSGTYSLWLDEVYSPLMATVSHEGYVTEIVSGITVTAQATKTVDVDLSLDAPCVTVQPQRFNIDILGDMSTTLALTLTNTGPISTFFQIRGRSISSPLAYQQANETLHLNGQVYVVEEAKRSDQAEALGQSVNPIASGGPDGFGYTLKDSTEADGPTYNWIEIAPPAGGSGIEITDLTGIDEGYFWPLSLPFVFNFYGTDYTDLALASNGTLNLENGDLGYTNKEIPGFYDVDAFIAHLWDDLYVTPGAIYYQDFGSMLVIEYYAVSFYGFYGLSPDSGTWQIILFDNGNILFQYQDLYFADSGDYGGSATVGIQGDSSTGLLYAYNTAVLADGLAICFAYPGQAADCSLGDAVPWLSTSPMTGTLAGDSLEAIEVVFDSSVLTGTGEYLAQLDLYHENDYQDTLKTLVTMTLVAGGFILTPKTNDLSGEAGSSVTHTLMITNLSTVSDIFDITLSGHQWPTNAPVSVGPISPGLSSEIDIVVDIPAQAMGATLDQVEVTAVLRDTIGPSQVSTLTTQVNAHYGLALSPAEASQNGEPDQVISYTLALRNTGNVSDIFDLSISPSAWRRTVSMNSISLAAQAMANIAVQVHIAADATDGDTQVATVTVTSQGDNGLSDEAVLRTRAVVTESMNCVPTVRSIGDGDWDDPAVWDQNQVPTQVDVVWIEAEHVITASAPGLVDQANVKGLCNFGLLQSQPDTDLRLVATDYISNYGRILGREGRSSSRQGMPGTHVELRGISSLGGVPIYNAADALIEAGAGGAGEEQGGQGGQLRIFGRNTANYGTMCAGRGGNVSGTGSGSAGGGGRSDIRGHYGGSGTLLNEGLACAGDGGDGNAAATNPQSGGSGGKLLLNSLPDLILLGQQFGGAGGQGIGGSDGLDGSVCIDPNTMTLKGDQARIEGGDILIFGGHDWILDLDNLSQGAISAKNNILLAVGSGGQVDLTNNVTRILHAENEVTIAADEIILDPDMTLTDVIQAINIVTQSSTIPSDVSVNGPSQLMVDAGQSVNIALTINNNGPLTDTYRLTTSNTEAWSSPALPNNITIAGLESTDLGVQLMVPTDVVSGLINTLIFTATSQNNSDVAGVEFIEIQAYNQIELPPKVYLPLVIR